jgi:hypothetical protein
VLWAHAPALLEPNQWQIALLSWGELIMAAATPQAMATPRTTRKIMATLPDY